MKLFNLIFCSIKKNESNSTSHLAINSNNLNLSLKTLAFFLVSALLLAIVIKFTPKSLEGFGMNETTLTYTRNYLQQKYAGVDSWGPMIKAVNQIRSFPEDSIYKALILKDQTKFQYPSSSLIFIDIPQKATGISWVTVIEYANKISWLALPIIAVTFLLLLLFETYTPFSKHDPTRINLSYQTFLATGLVSMVTVVMFYPIVRAWSIGQVQTLMTMFAGLALLAWKTGRFALAGVLLGICCGFKPQWFAIVPWAVLRRQWKFLIGFLAISITLIVVSIFLYGFNQWVDYRSVLSFLSQHGESFYPNQSMNGLLNRMLFNGSNLVWENNGFPPFNIWVYALTLSSSVLILGFATLWNSHVAPKAIDLAIIILSLTMASPIAWEHHYGVALFIFALVLPATLLTRPFNNWTIPYLWIAFILTSQKLEGITSQFAYTHWNFIQSYLYFGAILMLILLYKLSNLAHEGLHNSK